MCLRKKAVPLSRSLSLRTTDESITDRSLVRRKSLRSHPYRHTPTTSGYTSLCHIWTGLEDTLHTHNKKHFLKSHRDECFTATLTLLPRQVDGPPTALAQQLALDCSHVSRVKEPVLDQTVSWFRSRDINIYDTWQKPEIVWSKTGSLTLLTSILPINVCYFRGSQAAVAWPSINAHNTLQHLSSLMQIHHDLWL